MMITSGLINKQLKDDGYKWLNEYNLNKPKFYLRYIDDILAAFDNEQDSLNF